MSLVQTCINGFIEYPKIDTLFERNERFVVDPERIRRPVLSTISQWDVTEKIDGTNIRVMLGIDGEVQIGGRTQSAQIPADLVAWLIKMFPPERLKQVFWAEGAPTEAILFGEGYGAGIQRGGSYRPDKSFILFDVLVAGKWWLGIENIVDVAYKLNVDTAPYLGRMTLRQIVELVRAPFPSKIGIGAAEGIVAKPIETLFDGRGNRVIVKLKTKDFIGGSKYK